MARSETRRFTGTKRTASAVSAGRSNGSSSKRRRFVLCTDDRGYEGSLIRGKVYQVHKPEAGDQPYDLRVIDESGEDYLYSLQRFVEVPLPPKAQRAILLDR